MKKSTAKLALAASALYFALVFLLGGFFQSEITAPLYFLVGPLLLVVLIIVGDLADRTTSPTRTHSQPVSDRRVAHELRSLTRQIEVGTRASPEYFDRFLLARLRDILVERVSLETGMDRARVRDTIANPKFGRSLLGDRELYNLLYTKPPARGRARYRLLEEAISRIEAWKP